MKATLYCEFEKFKVHRSSCQLPKILNNWTALFMNLSISSCIEALMVALFVWIVLFSKLAQLEKFNQAYRAVINTI